MIIKVCGMREPNNIADLLNDVRPDWMGLIFAERSKRLVNQIPVHCGLMPDGSSLDANNGSSTSLVGVFVNQKVQDVVTRVYNYGLKLVQLHGNESPTYCRNLRATLQHVYLPHRNSLPADGIKLIKAISVANSDDIAKWQDYADSVDYLLFDTKCPTDGGSGKQFDWTVLDAYNGPLPFLLSGGIGPDDAQRVHQFMATHPLCIGIDLNSRFETAPALKDIPLLRQFLSQI